MLPALAPGPWQTSLGLTARHQAKGRRVVSMPGGEVRFQSAGQTVA
jgi:hypothetical protein